MRLRSLNQKACDLIGLRGGLNEMWVYLQNQDRDLVNDPINGKILEGFIDLSQLNGMNAGDCIELLEPAINDLSPNTWHLRYLDAKRHVKHALAKKIGLGERLGVLLECWDILFGWEGFWIPSSKNAEAKLRELMQIFQYCTDATVYIS